jgi:D-glycero-alpha-D-manno-heptose 1-phosphate guanylyltransferase
MQEAIVLAGGLGTRLRSSVADLPKVMAPVAGKPFLHYIITNLIKKGIRKIILSTGYRHEIIEEFIHHSSYDASFVISNETEPLGTGGGIKLAMQHAAAENIFIINGDSYFDIDLQKLLHEHLELNADITLALKPMQNFDRYGTVDLDQSRIISFNEKKFCANGLINAGVYILKKRSFSVLDLPEKFSFEKDVFEERLDTLNISGIVFTDYFIDIGIPEDYEKAQLDFNRMEF